MPVNSSGGSIQPGAPQPEPEEQDNSGQPLHAATFAQEQPVVVPANFKDLPVEEQERIKARLRFLGIRLRGDLENETVPISRETMDIP